VRIEDNTIIHERGPFGAMAWIKAWSGGNIYDSSANNGGANNDYWFDGPENGVGRYKWSSNLSQLSAYNATPGEENGEYITNSQKDSVLSSNNVPLSPER
jgi:hypothetical protein